MDARLLALTVHVVGFTVWVGALVAVATMLAARGDAPLATTARLAKSAARAMDAGAAVAILGGLWVLSYAPSVYMRQPWMHAKLTLVVVLLGVHGFVRARVGKMSRGVDAPFPRWVVPVATLLALFIIGLVINKPWQR